MFSGRFQAWITPRQALAHNPLRPAGCEHYSEVLTSAVKIHECGKIDHIIEDKINISKTCLLQSFNTISNQARSESGLVLSPALNNFP